LSLGTVSAYCGPRTRQPDPAEENHIVNTISLRAVMTLIFVKEFAAAMHMIWCGKAVQAGKNVTEKEAMDLVLRTLGRITPDADLQRLDPNMSFRDQIDIDSMDFLNFAVALRDELGRDIPETDYPKLSSLAGAVAYLQGNE
jgi:acyl carrier protein